MISRLRPLVLGERYSRLKQARAARHARILYTRSEATPEKTIAVRFAAILAAFSLVVAVFWFDRDGLKDALDGVVSFTDVLYFTMVTVTTVGYGDIVPVSDRARLLDAFLVTPVRIFVWFVFLGTAYELVIQKVLEDFKMSKLHQQLTGHIVVCGYGVTGRIAAKEMVARGTAPNKIVIIDIAEHNLTLAAESGFVGLRGDAASEEMMRLANVGKAKVVIVSPGRDDTSALIVLTVRDINPGVKIVASVYEEENFKLIRQAGANVIVSSARVGGFLLADAVENWHIAEYVLDLLTTDGRVSLVERPAKDDEIGRNALEVADGLLVRIFRSGEKIGFWEKDKLTIKAGDILLVIVHNDTGAEASQQA